MGKIKQNVRRGGKWFVQAPPLPKGADVDTVRFGRGLSQAGMRRTREAGRLMIKAGSKGVRLKMREARAAQAGMRLRGKGTETSVQNNRRVFGELSTKKMQLWQSRDKADREANRTSQRRPLRFKKMNVIANKLAKKIPFIGAAITGYDAYKRMKK